MILAIGRLLHWCVFVTKQFHWKIYFWSVTWFSLNIYIVASLHYNQIVLKITTYITASYKVWWTIEHANKFRYEVVNLETDCMENMCSSVWFFSRSMLNFIHMLWLQWYTFLGVWQGLHEMSVCVCVIYALSEIQKALNFQQNQEFSLDVTTFLSLLLLIPFTTTTDSVAINNT